MAIRGTILFAFVGSGHAVLSADGRAMNAAGAVHSDGALKVVKTGTRSAAAIGGSCEIIVTEGERRGQHWKLLESLSHVRDFPPTSTEDRARHVFSAAQKAAAEWLPHDTDPGVEGTNPKGITVLYAEVDKESRSHLWRADLPITTIADAEGRLSRTCGAPSIREIKFEGGGDFYYWHQPEHSEACSEGSDLKSLNDRDLQKFFEASINDNAKKVSGVAGGRATVLRIDGRGARMV